MSDTEIPTPAPAPIPAPESANPSEPWFARRFPTEDPRNGMGPVHWKGWALFIVFAGAMFFAALVFLFLVIAGSILLGVLAYAAITGGAMFALLHMVARKGDVTKTMEDYVKAKKHAGG